MDWTPYIPGSTAGGSVLWGSNDRYVCGGSSPLRRGSIAGGSVLWGSSDRYVCRGSQSTLKGEHSSALGFSVIQNLAVGLGCWACVGHV